MKDRNNDIIISGDNLDLTPAIKTMVIEKVAKLFEHEPQIIRIRVELRQDQQSRGNSDFIAAGIIEIRGKDMVVSVSSDDLYKSIDQLVSKLDRQLRRRSRLRVLKRKQTHEVEIPAMIPKASGA
jgi:putative sigma-54 modulation protein